MFKVGYEQSCNDGYLDYEIIHAVFDTNEQATEYCNKYNNQSRVTSKLISYISEVVDKESFVYAEGRIQDHPINKKIQELSALNKLHADQKQKYYDCCKENKNNQHPDAIQQKLLMELLFKELCEKKMKVDRERNSVIDQYKHLFKNTNLCMAVLTETEQIVWTRKNDFQDRQYLIVLGEVQHNPTVEDFE